jgi:SAM-dependent methyltransferase
MTNLDNEMARAEPPLFETIAGCRSCGSPRLREVVALGATALADRLLNENELGAPEPTAPLTVLFCSDCSLMQIAETVRPEVLFHSEYPYFSSAIGSLVERCRVTAQELIETRGLGSDSLVVELASNDGYMLQNFVARGIPVLGVDPSRAPAAAAAARGIPTEMAFFGRAVAERLAAKGTAADVMIANNVLAHVADLNGFVAGIARLLKPDGVAAIEFPYALDLLEQCEFDTIYHQHLCYFTVAAVDALFRRHELYINEVRHLPVLGGSLRIYAERTQRPRPEVDAMIAAERARGLDRMDAYADFAHKVRGIGSALSELVQGLRARGKRVAAYGAAAKGTTLMAYSGLDARSIDYVVDRNAFKQGRWMPGSRLPIFAPEYLLEDRPDYLLLLSWNYAAEIMEQQAEFRARGGRFIVPIPAPEVV